MDRKTINAQLRAQFFPVLAAEGFSRTGDILRRELDGGVVHVVEIQHRPRSGVFQVGLGAHLVALGDVVGGEPVPVANMRDHDCAWRSSVLSGFRRGSDAEFAYGATAADASESVAFLVSEWPRQSTAFFGGLSDFPEGFLLRAQESVFEGLHPAHLLTWARVADILGEAELRGRIVAAALPRVSERATSLRANLLALS